MKIRNRLAHFAEIYGPFKWPLIILTLFAICTQMLTFVGPYIYGRVIDGIIKGKPVKTLISYASISLCFLVLKDLLSWLHNQVYIRNVACWIENRTSEVTLSRALKLSLGQLLNHNSGFRQDIIKKGELALEELVTQFLFEITPLILRIIVALIGIFCINLTLGAVTALGVGGFIVTSVIINCRMMPQLRKLNAIDNKLGTAYWEIIKHLRLVIVHSQEKRAVREYMTSHDEYAESSQAAWLSYSNKVAVLREPFMTLGQFATLATGIWLVHSGTISPGKLVTALAWVMLAFGTIYSVSTLQRKLSKSYVHMVRYFELLEIPPAVTEWENPIRPERFKGRIEFRSVSFKYPMFKGRNQDLSEASSSNEDAEQTPAIENVSFVIEPGETCAFVGHSGAGKSTVINLILRGYDPINGQILIDGHDLRLLDLGQWRKSIGCVEQEPKLWDNTLKYNMAYGLNGHADTITDGELEVLAKKTRIDEFYDRLGSKRFETEIGENGVQLSGGQRQRVAIARAIAKSPAVLILDEATNALDASNQQLIHEAIDEALVGRTGIIIAHRLSTIRNADRIIVFDGGKVAGNGSHEELMRTCPQYQILVNRETATVAV